MPERGARQITLQDLATDTSGLPREPSTTDYPTGLSEPLEEYSVAQLYDFLNSCELVRDVGAQFEYSNVGAALLAHVLALRAGTDYETLVKSRILDPLGMKDTGVSLTPSMSARLAVGYGATSSGIGPVRSLPDSDAFAGAGALRSTADDMLVFLAALSGYSGTPLARSLSAMLRFQLLMDGQGAVLRDSVSGLSRFFKKLVAEKTGLAWGIFIPRALGIFRAGNDIFSHDGRTPGFWSFVGFDPEARVGVVLLSNLGYSLGVSDIGMHLLNPRFPLLKPPRARRRLSLDPALLESYVGRYQFSDDNNNDIWTIRREGNRMFGSHPGHRRTRCLRRARALSISLTCSSLPSRSSSSGKTTARQGS